MYKRQAYYCSGGEEQTGEKLVREALETWKGPKDEVLVATKVCLLYTSVLLPPCLRRRLCPRGRHRAQRSRSGLLE